MATTDRGPVVIGAVAGMVAITGGVLLLLPRHPNPLATSKCRQGGCDRAVVPAPGTVVPATVPLLTSPQSTASPSAAQPATVQATGRKPTATATTMTASPSATGTAPGGGGDTVTVTNPGSRAGTVGTAASLQVQATDSASGRTLAYSASGLPAGLSVSPATGLISGTPATAGTSTVTVTVTDGTGASGAATFTWTISSSGGGSGACTVTYTTTSQWTGGFVASVTITVGPSIDGWTLKFRFPGDQQVTNAWNGVESQSGENVTITNESYNADIPAGGSTSLGFQGTWSTSDAPPTSFTVNGTACG